MKIGKRGTDWNMKVAEELSGVDRRNIPDGALLEQARRSIHQAPAQHLVLQIDGDLESIAKQRIYYIMETMNIPEDEAWDPFSLSNNDSVGTDSIFDDDSWKDPFGSNSKTGSDVDSFFGFGDGDTAASWSSFKNVSDGSSGRAAVEVVDWPSPQGAESETAVTSTPPRVAQQTQVQKPRNASPKVSRAREIIHQRNQRRHNFSSGRVANSSADQAQASSGGSGSNQQSSNYTQPLDPEPSIPLDESMNAPATPRKSNTRKQPPALQTQKQQMEPPTPKASNASITTNSQQPTQTTIQRQSEPPQMTKYKSLDSWHTRQKMIQQKRIQKHWDENTINTANSILTDEMTHEQLMQRRQKQSMKQSRAGEQSPSATDESAKIQPQQKTQDTSIFSRNDLVFSQFTRLRRSQQQKKQVVNNAPPENENQTSSLSSRRLLWGGQLLQEPIQEEETVSPGSTEEEKKLEEPSIQNHTHVGHDQPHDEADQARGEVISMEKLAESAIQEATWKRSRPATHVVSKQSPTVRWPPYSKPKPPVVTPSPPQRRLKTYQSKDINQQPGAMTGVGNGVVTEQSPTRSDHSADAAAGAYLKKLRSICSSKSMDPPANDIGEDGNPTGVDSPERNSLASTGKKYVRSVSKNKDPEPSGQSQAMSGTENSANPDDERGISRKVSWDSEQNPHSPKVNLEAKLNQLSKHHKRMDSSNRSIGNVSASHVSVQPSVESECVHQNRQMFDMMDNMMNFFMTTEEDDAEEYDVDEILAEDMSEERDDRGGDYYPSSPGSCCGPGALEPLAEEDTILFDAGVLEPLAEEVEEDGMPITPTSYCSGDLLGAVAANDYQEEQPEYTSMRKLVPNSLPPESPEDEQVQDANAASTRATSKNLPNKLLIPAQSEEYDDPSLFNNSLMSDSSSELTPAVVAHAPMSKGNSNRALQVANENKNLNAFLDQFGDHILRGCQDGVRGDADSSDVFVVNNSQFGSNSQVDSDVKLSTPTRPMPNGEVIEAEKIYDGHGVILNQSVPLLRATTQISPISKIEEDSISEEEDPIVAKLQLPPASTFLSAKDRNKIRQIDTTPLRTNTSRARRFRRHYKSYSETQSMASIKEDADVEESSRSPSKQGKKDEQVAMASSTVPEGNAESLSEVKHIDNEDKNLDPPADEANSPATYETKNDGEFTTSYREARKGHSLAWQTSNGVNNDEMYDAKDIPPSRANVRAANLVKRLNLLSIMSNNATTFQSHFDSPQQEGLSSLYTQNNTANDGSDESHLFDESYCSDNEEDNASTSEDGIAYERRDDECSAHENVVRDFQDIISKVESVGKSPTGVQEVTSPGSSKLLSLEEMIANESAASNDHSSHLVELRQKAQQTTPSDVKNEAPIRYQMHLNESASLAQRKALYLSGGSRIPARHRGPRTLRQVQSNTNSSTNNRQQPHHPHHVPKHQEVSKSRLEEKLRGIAERDTGGRDAMKQSSGACSVGTSELGSLLTRASDKSHFGSLPVPLTIFHRTHPHPLVAGETGSARSSPSSMQNTYFDPSSGVGVIARSNQTTGGNTPQTPEDLHASGCQQNMGIANQVSLLLPDPDEDEDAIALAHCQGAGDVAAGSQIVMQCPTSTTKQPAVRQVKATHINNVRNSQTMHSVESSRKAAAAAIAKIDEELLRSKAKTTGIGVDVFPSTPPTRVQKSSMNETKATAVKPKSYLVTTSQNDTNPQQKFPQQRAMIARNKSNRAITTAASSMVMSGLNQHERHASPQVAPSNKIAPVMNNVSVHVQRRLDSNEKIVGTPVSSHTSSFVKNAPHQIPKSFNSKSINSRNRKGGMGDDASQQSSVFEAFEIAPISTTIANKNNSVYNTSFLNDLGVHHHLRHKRDAKKKVGFPEAVSQRQPTRPKDSSVSEPFKEAGFEVMLQSRKANKKIFVPSNSRPPKSTPTNNQRVPSSNIAAVRTQQPISIRNVEPMSGSHRDKIRQRIRLGWKKMTAPAQPQPNASASVSQRTAKPEGSGPKPLNGSSKVNEGKMSGQWVAKTDAHGKIQFTQRV